MRVSRDHERFKVLSNASASSRRSDEIPLSYGGENGGREESVLRRVVLEAIWSSLVSDCGGLLPNTLIGRIGGKEVKTPLVKRWAELNWSGVGVIRLANNLFLFVFPSQPLALRMVQIRFFKVFGNLMILDSISSESFFSRSWCEVLFQEKCGVFSSVKERRRPRTFDASGSSTWRWKIKKSAKLDSLYQSVAKQGDSSISSLSLGLCSLLTTNVLDSSMDLIGGWGKGLGNFDTFASSCSSFGGEGEERCCIDLELLEGGGFLSGGVRRNGERKSGISPVLDFDGGLGESSDRGRIDLGLVEGFPVPEFIPGRSKAISVVPEAGFSGEASVSHSVISSVFPALYLEGFGDSDEFSISVPEEEVRSEGFPVSVSSSGGFSSFFDGKVVSAVPVPFCGQKGVLEEVEALFVDEEFGSEVGLKCLPQGLPLCSVASAGLLIPAKSSGLFEFSVDIDLLDSSSTDVGPDCTGSRGRVAFAVAGFDSGAVGNDSGGCVEIFQYLKCTGSEIEPSLPVFSASYSLGSPCVSLWETGGSLIVNWSLFPSWPGFGFPSWYNWNLLSNLLLPVNSDTCKGHLEFSKSFRGVSSFTVCSGFIIQSIFSDGILLVPSEDLIWDEGVLEGET